MTNSPATRYGEVNDRLKEIAALVADDTLPLDDALDLFEEAVKLGMQASSLLEEDVAQRDAAEAGSAESGDATADGGMPVGSSAHDENGVRGA